MSNISSLLHAANSAVNAGQWAQADRIWRQVLAIDPRNGNALYGLGMHAFRRGQLAEAKLLLGQAAATAQPRDPMLLLSLAIVHRDLGEHDAEAATIEEALVADPYFLPGLLARGDLLHRRGLVRLAATTYRDALRVAPPEPQWPAPLRAQLANARAVSEKHSAELAEFFQERLGTRMEKLSDTEAQRWREAGAILSGQSRPYLSQCNRLYVPRLPAVPFFERSAFEWTEALEAQTETITRELRALLADGQQDFSPYVAYQPGTPVNQWTELNHSKRWSSYFLWRNGAMVQEAAARCPRTAEALAAVDMADIGGLCPNAMFSLLAPHTHIPPHHGETNARVVVHLPLIVPEGCSYRVGFERRQWRVGEILAFDDSIEHEARNDSDELRVVLIFDAWNPLLSPAERDMVRALSAAAREFNADPPG